MSIDEPRAASVTDPDGHEVVLLIRIWEGKIRATIPNSLITLRR